MKTTSLMTKGPTITRKTCSVGLSLLTISLLVGCQSVPSTAEDVAQSLEEMNNSVTVSSQWQSNSGNNEQAFENSGWLKALNDDRLEQFIQIALSNNPDLRASAASLQANIQTAKASGAPLWPQLDARLNRNRVQSENPENTSGTPIYSNSYTGSYNISWEIDIWGKLNAQRKASVLETESQRANYAAAELALVANVSRAWFNLNALKMRLDIANQRLESQQSTLAVIEDNYKLGLNSALEVYLNRTDLASQTASIIDLQDSLEQSIRAFKQLLGEYPSNQLDFESQLPTLEGNVPAGLPSEILIRRPDVLASLRQWQSSEQHVKAANRARLPSFSLSASYGASSEELKFLDQKQLLWNLVNNLSVPLFQGGRLAAQAKQAEYLKNASFENYMSTLLKSYTEVENSLSSEQALKKRFSAIKDAAYYSESGYKLALEQYQSGLINYTTMLESQRRWFDAQSNLIALKNSLLQNRIALYLALGGDFAGTNEETDALESTNSATTDDSATPPQNNALTQ